jgi:hypothetical protein
LLFWQLLIDGFAISSLYTLGATGFTLIFGATGMLNLSHGRTPWHGRRVGSDVGVPRCAKPETGAVVAEQPSPALKACR